MTYLKNWLTAFFRRFPGTKRAPWEGGRHTLGEALRYANWVAYTNDLLDKEKE